MILQEAAEPGWAETLLHWGPFGFAFLGALLVGLAIGHCLGRKSRRR